MRSPVYLSETTAPIITGRLLLACVLAPIIVIAAAAAVASLL
jgi:hypothetical protein